MPILFPLRPKTQLANRLASGRGVGPLIARRPLPVQPAIVIAGVTRDKTTGVALPGCTLKVIRTSTDATVETLVSDGAGGYVTSPVGLGLAYRVDAYLPGSPDKAGTTANTLAGG